MSNKPPNVPPTPAAKASPTAPKPQPAAPRPPQAAPLAPRKPGAGLGALGAALAAPKKAPEPAEKESGPVPRRTIQLVQESWAKVFPISDAAAALFYERLFELEPSVRPLFKADISEQKKKLMQTLSVAVDGLTNLEKLVPVLQGLGVRHAGYMVQEHHYDVVGEALLWTLREGLGDEFNSDVETAWTQVYTLVADVMKKAAADHGAPAGKAAKDDVPPLPFGPASLPRGVAALQRSHGVTAPSPKVDPSQISAPPESIGGRTLLGVAGPGGAAAAAAERAAAKRDEKAPAKAPAPEPADDGPVSARTIRLVQTSWAKVFPISDAAATLFYDRLFEMDPSVRPMFKSDMREQKKKLMQTLSVAVDGLNNLPKLVPVLKDLGARHAGYMVQDHHYDLVGGALLWTLREGLGDEFNDEVELAWTEVYTLVADVMKGAAAEVGGGPVKTAPAGAPPQAQKAAPQAKAGSPSEDEVETLHYDSSRRPPIFDELGIPVKSSAGGQRTEPVPGAAPAPTPAPAAAAPAAAPAPPRERERERERAPAKPAVAARPAAISEPPPEIEVAPLRTSVVLPISGNELTLNVKLTLDGPLPSLPREAAAPAPDAGASGALAPALFLATMCAVASMALATLTPELGPKLIPQLDVVSPLAVPILVLVLILAAFGLGYLWGRGRRPAGAGVGASK